MGQLGILVFISFIFFIFNPPLTNNCPAFLKKGDFMDHNLERKIRKRYDWFVDYLKDNTLHCDCEDGWYKIIREWCYDVEKIYSDSKCNISDLYILRIEEKLGKLNILVSSSFEEVQKISREYEEKSLTVCELCCGRGKLSICNLGELKTLCKKCRNKIGYEVVNK